jgi:hypothetical protein
MRRAVFVVVAIALLTGASAWASAVKTTAKISKITRTTLPGDDQYTANGKVTADLPGCLKGRKVEIIQKLGPPFNDKSLMQTVYTDKKGRWKAKWTTRSGAPTGTIDIEEASTGVHYIEVERLKKKHLNCSFARSKEYLVPPPAAG